MRNVGIIMRRELTSYFATPLAYIFILIFLVLANAFTFYLGNFYERGNADLDSFFGFHPWLYLFLIRRSPCDCGPRSASPAASSSS